MIDILKPTCRFLRIQANSGKAIGHVVRMDDVANNFRAKNGTCRRASVLQLEEKCWRHGAASNIFFSFRFFRSSSCEYSDRTVQFYLQLVIAIFLRSTEDCNEPDHVVPSHNRVWCKWDMRHETSGTKTFRTSACRSPRLFLGSQGFHRIT